MTLTLADKATRAYELWAAPETTAKCWQIGWDLFTYLGSGISRTAFKSHTDGKVYKITRPGAWDASQAIVEDNGYSWAREQGIQWVPESYVTVVDKYTITVSEYCPTNTYKYFELERTHKGIWNDIQTLAGDVHENNVGFRPDGSPVLIDGGRFYPEDASKRLEMGDTPDLNRTADYQPSYVAARLASINKLLVPGCPCSLCNGI